MNGYITWKGNKMATLGLMLVTLATLEISVTGYAVLPSVTTENMHAAILQEKYNTETTTTNKIGFTKSNTRNNEDGGGESINYMNKVFPVQNKHLTVKKAIANQQKPKTTELDSSDHLQVRKRKFSRSLSRLESVDVMTDLPDVGPSSTVSLQQEVRFCVHKYNTSTHAPKVSFETDNSGNYDDMEDQDTEGVLPAVVMNISGVQMERCVRHSDPCYALWTENQHGEKNIIAQGCLESSAGFECSPSVCVWRPTSSPPKASFCCCHGNMCNDRPSSVTPAPAPSSPGQATTASLSPTQGPALLWAVLCLLPAAALVICCYCYCRNNNINNNKTTLTDNGELGILTESGGGPGFSCSTTCVDNLKLHDNIGCGRVGVVWRGSLGNVPVAVKAVPTTRKAAWSKERELYCLPHMQHTNLLLYLGCDTRWTLEGSLEHLLVLQLAPLGSLREYLINNTLDWNTFTGMALGVASALAHLHTHIRRDGQYKPCIVHRDVNSSNVVVMADLSVCLCDLGLAMALSDDTHTKTAHNTQQHKIQEAGTLRYLSPEALEGALDLRRCDSALRAVDVYALSLVLWELLSRCAALHRAPGPPSYSKPYHTQLGGEPDPERMRLLVTRRKVRPLFCPLLMMERAVKLTKDTIEDCWDHDAEARLTAVCVVERLTELRSLRPAASPTINTNDLRPGAAGGQDGVTTTPSPGGGDGKNSNLVAVWALPSTLQPHQGRNPCMERNLAPMGPTTTLIDRSLKDLPPPTTTAQTNPTSDTNVAPPQHDFSRTDMSNAGNVRSTRTHTHTNTNTTNQHIHTEEHNIYNEMRTVNRPVTPLGYVQNDVSEGVGGGGGGGGNTDKQTNIKQDNQNQRWSRRNIRKLLDSKMFRRKHNNKHIPLETEVNLVLANGKPINNQVITTGRVKTSVIVNESQASKCNQDLMMNRPCSLPGLDQTNNTCTVSPPNQTVSHNLIDNVVKGYKELPINLQQQHNNTSPNKIFAVIVPKTNYTMPDDKQTTYQSGDNFCHYNTDTECAVDYSSNSEDEHMLLLSEEGGEKITMRQRQGASLTRGASCLKNKYTNNTNNKYKKVTLNEAQSLHGSNLSLCKLSDVSYNIIDLKNDSNNSSLDNVKVSNESVSMSSTENKRLVPLSIKHNQLSRQHSLELVSCLFSLAGSLKDPALRIKTPGDVPPSVRRLRALRNNNKHNNNRLSLYDDRMMFGNSL